MLQETTDIQELSLEKVIETRLVQGNVTDQILASLKDKYGGMKLKSLDDKESYLELKAAAKDCAKVRTLTVKLCKEGRERAVKEQKLWISKEKEIVGKVAEVEDALDSEIKLFDDEVERKANEEKNRQEEAYIGRQAALTKMGAVYQAGCFVLGDASFEAELVKGASQDIWEEAVLPKFDAEYQKIEAVRIAEEKKKAEAEAEIERQRQELARQQEEFRLQQEQMRRDQEEVQRKADEERKRVFKIRSTQLEGLGMRFSFQYDAYVFEDVNVDNKTEICLLGNTEWDELIERIKPVIEQRKQDAAKKAEEQRQAEIKEAEERVIKAEQARQAEAARQREEMERQEAARKAEELEQASDKVKYADLIAKFKAIDLPEMRSGQYRKKVYAIREKLNEILAL